MCDQTEVPYLENDVVWVKIGPIWWPGVVKDLDKDEEGREILAGLKKKPIAAVKFFQEDNYEFVKNLDQIYHYNCSRKDEFIKKGLDKFRTGAPHMKKFPDDVTTAETLVNGDVNIVNDPKFYPEKKQSYSEIFGSGKKKSKKEVDLHSKPKSRKQNSGTPYRPITHKRFINKALHGESDHTVRTLIQPSASPEDSARGIYKCHVCRFETSRVNVIVAHHRLSHSPRNSINWTGSETKVIKRKPTHKSRKSKPRKFIESLVSESSDDEVLEKKRFKTGTEKVVLPSDNKGNSSPPHTATTLTPQKRKGSEDALEDGQKKPRYTDVLLADWSEEDEEDKDKKELPCNNEDNDKNDETLAKNTSGSTDASGKDSVSDPEKEKGELKNQNEKMSCFDFDEEEEGFIGMSNANTYGRKIPRVIPLKDKSELGAELEIGDIFKKKTESDDDDDAAKDDASDLHDDKSDKNETVGFDANNQSSMNKEAENEDDEPKVESNEDDEPKVESNEDDEPKVESNEDDEPKVESNEDDELKVESNEDDEPKVESNEDDELKVESNEEDQLKVESNEEKEKKVAKRKRKSSKDLEIKVDEESLAVRRTRRPGAKKSYLNEVIEKIEDDDPAEYFGKVEEPKEDEVKIYEIKSPVRKVDTGSSSSRRKQDFKIHTLEDEDEETIFCETFGNEKKINSQSPDRKCRGKAEQAKIIKTDDLTRKIDTLLAETNVPIMPEILATSEFKVDPVKSANTLSISFDYISPENVDKGKTEVKSITKMFSNSMKSIETEEKEQTADDSDAAQGTEVKGTQNFLIGKVASSTLVTPSKHQISDRTGGDEGNSGNDLNPANEELIENVTDDSENVTKTKSIKTLKLKSDMLPSTILSPTGKLKSQTIIHQKGGTYVILSQPPQLPRQKLTTAKGQTGGKLVILTNQLGEQKIITTGGLQQSKFKIEPQKVAVASGTSEIASTSSILTGKTQPIIKMVPDGKGGIVKQLTVSPKKVLVGGTKVLVSAAGTAGFPTQGGAIQKIALSGGSNFSGDYRLIENYKGSGKTVLIQGSSGTSAAGVLLKTSSSIQRHGIGDAVQSTPNILNVKKKPKILMRTAPGQNEFVVHSELATIDSPTYVMKRKGADGKFSTQKIIRRPVVTHTKTKPTGSKTFILSSEQGMQQSDSLILQASHEPGNKIIRLTPKVREPDVKPKFTPKIIQKATDSFNISENTILATNETEGETTLLQVAQNQPQQPILQTQVMAMPGPIGSDGNQTYVLVSVDEHGVVQPVDNSLITYDTSGQTESVFMNPATSNNVIVINPPTNPEIKPVFSNGSQDILAEALANTNVLEGNMSSDMETVIPSILLPPSIPSSVVQETSITLQKPIMTPLEMPTSVAPDTSGLEPPPLPPTPTVEDVLMGDQDAGEEEELINVENTKEQEKKQCLIEKQTEMLGNNEDDKIFYEDKDLIDNCSDQGSSSLQSMPLLNDEPDTSDDAQGSEPIGNQDFEVQKCRAENEELTCLLRGQEPPSSTNNEMTDSKMDALIEEPENEEVINENEKPQDDLKVVENRELQSVPVITDDGSLNSYAFGQIYVDSLSQKRFQEETEVTSTTDEISNKDNNVV